jgi:ribosomal protein S18 acetylase RimI-like enzyme
MIKFSEEKIRCKDLNFISNEIDTYPAIKLRIMKDEKSIGEITYNTHFRRLLDLEIVSEHRQKGYGKRLVREAIKRYNPKELNIISDEHRNSSLPPRPLNDKQLINFYSRFGFKIKNNSIDHKCYKLIRKV